MVQVAAQAPWKPPPASYPPTASAASSTAPWRAAPWPTASTALHWRRRRRWRWWRSTCQGCWDGKNGGFSGDLHGFFWWFSCFCFIFLIIVMVFAGDLHGFLWWCAWFWGWCSLSFRWVSRGLYMVFLDGMSWDWSGIVLIMEDGNLSVDLHSKHDDFP